MIRGIRSLSILVTLAGVLLPACVSADKYMRLEDELLVAQEELQFARDQLSRAEEALSEGSVDGAELASLRSENAALAAEREALAAKYAALEGTSQRLSDVGLEMFNAGNGMVGYRGRSDVFFASGSATLTGEGKKALDTLIPELKGDNSPIRVSGHTDTDPVVKTKDLYPGGNMELGAQRALSVCAYLIDKGLDAKRISVESWGPHRPVVSGSSKDDKARNRRVEILVPLAKS